MPDYIDNHAVRSAPGGWGELFAALPSQTPPADGWARLDRALDARSPRMRAARRERRMSWLIGIASAAVLVLVAWAPVSGWLHDGNTGAQRPSMTTAVRRGPAAPVRADVATMTHDVATEANVVLPASSRDEALLRRPVPMARRVARRTEANTPAPRPMATASRARSERPATSSNSGAAADRAATNSAASEALQRLKTQSAQLEALVALARDDRVGNAGSALLSSKLDAGIAAIDAALSQPDLGNAGQQDLWQQRVDLLQQLAGMEATSRWLAAQGTANDTTLVSVD